MKLKINKIEVKGEQGKTTCHPVKLIIDRDETDTVRFTHEEVEDPKL